MDASRKKDRVVFFILIFLRSKTYISNDYKSCFYKLNRFNLKILINSVKNALLNCFAQHFTGFLRLKSLLRSEIIVFKTKTSAINHIAKVLLDFHTVFFNLKS